MTAGAPVGSSGCTGQRSRYSRANSSIAGSTCATAALRISPVGATRCAEHQSASWGTVSAASRCSASSASSVEPSTSPARASRRWVSSARLTSVMSSTTLTAMRGMPSGPAHRGRLDDAPALLAGRLLDGAHDERLGVLAGQHAAAGQALEGQRRAVVEERLVARRRSPRAAWPAGRAPSRSRAPRRRPRWRTRACHWRPARSRPRPGSRAPRRAAPRPSRARSRGRRWRRPARRDPRARGRARDRPRRSRAPTPAPGPACRRRGHPPAS